MGSIPRRCALWLAVVALGCAAEAGDAPPVDADDGLDRRVLDNGLEVAVLPRHASPVVLALGAFRAGAFVEDADTDGYSHLLEHMLFKGSDAVPEPVEFRNRLRGLGALSNATTGTDRVTFFYQLPNERLGEGLSLMAGALAAPALDAGALAQEIEVVLAEFDLVESDYGSLARRRLIQLAFPDHPSRKDPLGQRDVIAGATRADLRAMHERYYVPNNALMLLAGDVEAEAGHALLAEHFGGWPTGPDPFEAHPVPEHPPLERDVAEVVTAPVQTARLLVAFHGPDTRGGVRATLAASLLARVTQLSDHSLRQIVGAPVVLGAGLGYDRSRHTGVFVLSVEIGLGHERDAVERTWDAIRALGKRGDVSQEQLGAARGELWAGRFHASASSSGLAFRLANEWGVADLDFSERYVDTLYDLELGDLAAVVADHVTDRPKAIVLLTTEHEVEAQALTAGYLEGAL